MERKFKFSFICPLRMVTVPYKRQLLWKFNRYFGHTTADKKKRKRNVNWLEVIYIYGSFDIQTMDIERIYSGLLWKKTVKVSVG